MKTDLDIDGWWEIEAPKSVTPETLVAIRRSLEALRDRPHEDIVAANGLTLRWHARPDSLDAAWAEAEAALPKGWAIVELSRVEHERDGDWITDEWVATAALVAVGRPVDRYAQESGTTREAALRALAAKLRER